MFKINIFIFAKIYKILLNNKKYSENIKKWKKLKEEGDQKVL